jgi:photosystem II stability/assembly factor-like uncharacterized protein
MNNRLQDDKTFSLVRGALPEIDDDTLSANGAQARSVLDSVLTRVQRPSIDEATATAGIKRLDAIFIGGPAQERGRRRSLAGAAIGVAALLVVGALTLQSAGHSKQPGSRTAIGPVAAPKWRLVGDITSAWRTLSLEYEPGLFLACPSTTACYADNLQEGAPGTYGEVEVTHDGGDTWQSSNLPVTLSGATPLACVDADTCATLGIDASGNATFVETTDGGATWHSVAGPSQLTSSMGVTVLACTTAESCVAIASDPAGQSGPALAFVTNDGGNTWTDANLPSDFVPGGLQCVSAGNCIVTGFYQSPEGSSTTPPGTVLYSSDDGATWATATLPSDLGPLSSISCADSADCVASFFGDDGSSSEILISTDGGLSWSQASASGLPAEGITGISCPTASECWEAGIADASGGSAGSGTIAVRVGLGAQGIVASTADGGQTWQSQQLPQRVLVVLDIACPSSTNCYAVAAQQSSTGSQASYVLLAYGS